MVPELAKNLADEAVDGIIVEPDGTVPVTLYGEATKLSPDSAATEIDSLRESLSTEEALPHIKLNAIAWDENPGSSIAVLNDRIVHEGDFLGDVRILRIKPNHVVLLHGDEHVIKKIHREDREQSPEPDAVKTNGEEEYTKAQEDSSFTDYSPIVNFDYRTSRMAPGAYEKLDRIATIAKLSPDCEIVVRGYTDSVGSYKFNQRLSLKRAKIVAGYLVEKGVSPEKIETIGMGEIDPLVPNDTPEGRAANRRVEIQLVPVDDN
jgi:outer membrane protein OmpA-like peptidoglycan-associated protein